ncbi:hypothetical protein HAX54_019996 [Datura stramonium]|uniref:Uncharacterized protein n=1 Tax=Datura stramonium TaxID=4076 RepID=A0ABS8S4E4_DATST|nr:hypothetical protein [Datura stramonium]
MCMAFSQDKADLRVGKASLINKVLDEGKASCGMTRLGDSMVKGKASCGMNRLGEVLDEGKASCGMTWLCDGMIKCKASYGMTRLGEGKASLWEDAWHEQARKLENILSVMLGTLGAGMGDDSRARRACALAWAPAYVRAWALACARTRQTRRENRTWQGRWHAHARGRCGGKVGTDPDF